SAAEQRYPGGARLPPTPRRGDERGTATRRGLQRGASAPPSRAARCRVLGGPLLGTGRRAAARGECARIRGLRPMPAGGGGGRVLAPHECGGAPRDRALRRGVLRLPRGRRLV